MLRPVLRWLAGRKPVFETVDVEIGRNVSFGRNVRFTSRKVRIGDGVVFHDDIQVDSEVFTIGDYGTISRGCNFPGPGELRIGHNFWLGPMSIVDSQGGTTIGDNVGVGAHSQLWTHMIYGDVMAGCRFHSVCPLVIEDDVWFVGHCLVSPIRAGARSLAMLGSVVTRDMEADHTYAGLPAKDITDRAGPQFQENTTDDRRRYLEGRLEEFAREKGIGDLDARVRIVTGPQELAGLPEDVIGLDVAGRTYAKRRTRFEAELIRFLLPEAKFTPAE